MRVMITGATAPLGAALIGALLASDDVDLVLAVGRERDPHLSADPRLIYRSVDLTRPRALHDLVWGEGRRYGIEAVIHGIHHRSARDRGRAVHRQNVEATCELVHACSHHPTIRRFIYRSFAEVYQLSHTTSNLLDEDSPLDFATTAPQWVRDRVEADASVCAHFGEQLELVVLRCAEILAKGVGSQLWDYLQSQVCLRPLGFDPMVNMLSLDDAVSAFVAALRSTATGVFNIPGHDTLPLSLAISESRRFDLPLPGPLMSPLYNLRRTVAGHEFRYDLNLQRFHFGGVLDGARARRVLGFVPSVPVAWPRQWWSLLVERLAQGSRDAKLS